MVAIIAVIFWLVPILAHATTYYVSTAGNNSNDGLSESSPWLTVKKAVDTMVAGDTTYVRGGTYTTTGVIQFSVTGTASAPIKLLNYPGELPIITYTSSAAGNGILIQNALGFTRAIGWITIEGFELSNGYDGIKWYNLHNSTISNNYIHHHANQGILGNGGKQNLITKNVIALNGPLTGTSNKEHGIYAHGSFYTITRNVIYGNQAYGIQQNGSSTSVYSSAKHPSADFAGANNWIVEGNTFAYELVRSGYVIWGSLCTDSRYENNIFFENNVQDSGSAANGIHFASSSDSTGISIRNNHYYASGSGATAQHTTSTTYPADLVSTGHVVNVSPPAFVNGGSNSLPASPDFSLTASAPVNIARVNEFTNNSTNVVGAYKTIGTCTGSVTANKIKLTCPLSTATPVQNLTSTGVYVGCTGSSCPAAHSVSSVARAVGTMSQIEIVISGISGNACVSTNQNWNVSYDASLGTWSGNDNIGPYPGSHQKIFSFTGLSVANNCTGSGPASYPSGYHIFYKFDDGSGINANDESANSLDGTLTNGPGWGPGKTGYGIVMSGNDTKYVAVPYGSGVNPSTQSLTIAIGVNIPAGQENLSRSYIGVPLGTNQRGYISQRGGTFTIGIQNSNDSAAGNIAVTSGWHNLCLVFNSSTDIATLYVDGVASTSSGAVKSYTSYTFSGNFAIGNIAGLTSGGAAGTYDDFLLYTSVQDCAAISAAFNASSTLSGTFAQAAIQFQGVILDTAGSPIVVGPSVQAIEVPAGGGVVLVFQVHCQNVSNCDPTAFRLVYDKNGSGVFQHVPDIETTDGTWMWGVTAEANLNNGTRATRLTGSCAVTTGATQVTASQIYSVDLPQDGCTIMAYIARVGASQAGNYFDYKLQTEAGADFSGGYAQTARIRVVNPMASGIGF